MQTPVSNSPNEQDISFEDMPSGGKVGVLGLDKLNRPSICEEIESAAASGGIGGGNDSSKQLHSQVDDIYGG